MKLWTFKKHFVLSTMIIIILVVCRIVASLLNVMIHFGGRFLSYDFLNNVAIISGTDGPTAIYGYSLMGILTGYNDYVLVFIVMLLLYKPL